MSKGSRQRPTDREAYERGWDRVFAETAGEVNAKLRADLDQYIQGDLGCLIRDLFPEKRWVDDIKPLPPAMFEHLATIQVPCLGVEARVLGLGVQPDEFVTTREIRFVQDGRLLGRLELDP